METLSMSRPHMAEPEPRRRRRPPVSCVLCRQRKIKCNREMPCSNCSRSKNANCVYRDGSPLVHTRQDTTSSSSLMGTPLTGQSKLVHPGKVPGPGNDTATAAHSGSSMSVVASADSPATSIQPSPSEIQALRIRIRQLEEQLAKASPQSTGPATPSPHYNISTTTSHFAGTFHVHSESATADQLPTISRAIMHKTRVFGQSHWMHGVAQFAEVLDIIDPFLQDEGLNVMTNLTKCKWLGKMIKAQRTPTWPCPPTIDLPPKKITDDLVANYLRTSETVYRVLHVPTFRRDYEAAMRSNETDISFLVLLKLVMAIGSTVFDEKFSMRATAIRWIHEAQTWVSEPEFKARLSLQFLQTQILLLLARESVGVDGALVWVSTGQLIRLAVYMGLNRDPQFLPKMPCYSSEMRRRLWNTILELELQASMQSGGPPLSSLEDSSTLPPGNFDDEAITGESPTSAPDDIFTEVSVSLALRKTFPLRLHIAKVLNGTAAHTGYQETLRLDSEIRASNKWICRQLQGYRATSKGRLPSNYQTRILDLIIHRYLTALHMPFFSSSLKEAKYAYSRKVVVETSVKTWFTTFPSPSASTSSLESSAPASEPDDLSRLALCGTGMFRTTSSQAVFLIAAELKTQLQEETSLCSISPRPDLFTILKDAKKWSIGCIEAGETNIKGYLFLCLVVAQIEALMRGISREELPKVLLEATEEAETGCLEILESIFDAANGNTDQAGGATTNLTTEMMGDWSLMMPDTHFYLGDSDNMDWMTMDSLAASASYASNAI